MPKRPLIQKGVAELEKLFDQRRNDPDFLNDLLEELSERKTQRAQELRQRAVQARGTIAQRPGSRIDTSEPAAESPIIVAAKPVGRPTSPIPRPVSASAKTIRPTLERPSVSNDPGSILSAWTAMEVLSPPSFRKPEDLASGDRYRIARIDKDVLPWENGGEKSRPNQKLYYQVILGSIDMEATVSALLAVYTDSRAERPQARGEAVLATIMVDREGRPVESEAVSISSFGWGIPVALGGRLSDLGQWSQAKESLVEGLTAKTVISDRDGNPLPLTRKTIQDAYDWLVQAVGLPTQFARPPAFAVRSYQYFKLQDPPESILLNSFFLDDLAAARALVASGKATPNLKRYLGVLKPGIRRNLMKDNEALSEALEPRKFPLGSWPGDGRHPLALLQQCAVNLALHDLNTAGILAVNGPPGTGKTTLLRDVIAALVTKRAEILCTYDEPESAFIHSGQKLKKGNSFVHLYRLDNKIRGYEMIVASSNNKAVENVSAELPAMQAIAGDAGGLRYFKTVSDALLERDTWGAVAAVLGNGKNRSDFRQTFWWDDDVGLQRYLQQASGNPQLITEKTDTGTKQRPPHVIVKENAPEDHDEALRRWKKARQHFRKVAASSKSALAELQKAHDLLRSIRQKQETVDGLAVEIEAMQPVLAQLAENAGKAVSAFDIQKRNVEALDQNRAALWRTRPGFLSRLFGAQAFRSWRAAYDILSKKLTSEKTALSRLSADAETKRSEYARANGELQKMQASITELTETLRRERVACEDLARRYPGTFISEEFFDQRHQDKQKSAPWLDAATARLRNDVFEAAMALHKAFVDGAAKPIRHNLNVLMDGFGTRSLGSPEKDALIPDLWSTLFLLVPVVSTTFASVSRMFSKIGPESFGWLLVDEAGQALPQAAVGALVRTQRAMVVGDPIQIEPVVVLPDQLTEAMCQQFGIDPLIYNAPGASAQTLADSATEYYGTFETKFGTREVGVPLLVHRRCAEPMFSISNSIAYENLMVQAKAAKPSAIRDVLGPSRWIDVEGRGQEKWCPQEGDALLAQLRHLRDRGCAPDFYVVTPFVVVQDRMREVLRSSDLLDGWIETPYQWVRERIGTVHTVQGREAEAVFFILGAPDAQQRGARGWAGGRPNLLNVAATRAKEALYVVGNRSLWKTAGVFQSLDDFLD
ncbi:DEAD/DEAH box helicase [Neorhizobium sp. DT-125]|uniref:DEAD/DEAH box helicase n=1 Tax=Neorhizobium sp. DT-125 TaxID=3396163 RepID=UPI003F1A4856